MRHLELKHRFIHEHRFDRQPLRPHHGVLVMIGDGPDREPLERRVDEQGLRSRVRFVGEEHDLVRWLSAADVFRMAGEGDPTCQELVGETCRALGAGLAVIVNGLNPERLIVTGEGP